MRRHILGILALLFLVGGVAFWIWPPRPGSMEFLHGTCIKVGLVLAAIWAAYPQLVRLPGWVFGAIVAGMVMLAVRPKVTGTVLIAALRYSVYLVPLLVILWLLRPRAGKNDRSGKGPTGR